MDPAEDTEFRRKAAALSACAHEIVRCLESHDGTPYQVEYGRALARLMLPLVEAYDRAVFQARSREAAADLLGEINELVRGAGAAASKGDMGFDFGSALSEYYELHTIFRETRYRSDVL